MELQGYDADMSEHQVYRAIVSAVKSGKLSANGWRKADLP